MVVLRIWKQYFQDLYNVDTQDQVENHLCGFVRGSKRQLLLGEPIKRTEVKVRAGKLKNGKAAGKDEITREMIKGEGDRVVDLI